MLIASFGLLAGLILLYYGAELLVEGSSKFALSFGVRPLVVGMTIVALATSMPEFLVSLAAVIRQSSDLAAGNVIGSNIANIGLILGAASLIAPMRVERSTLMRELPIMLALSLLTFFFALDGELGRLDGFLLLLGLGMFLVYCYISSRRAVAAVNAPAENAAAGKRLRYLTLVLLGIVGLGLGAELMVRSAIHIAHALGVSDLVIGITVVALGTSLPELAASMVSAWKGEGDLSVGNVIGSNIFNLAFVLASCALVRPLKIEAGVVGYELPLMLVFSLMLWPLVYRRQRLGRTEGVILVAGYLVFVACYFY